VTPLFCVQAKLRKSLPVWLWQWMSGIVGSTPIEKVGILVLMKPGQEQKDALVVLRYGDFVDLCGSLRREEEGR